MIPHTHRPAMAAAPQFSGGMAQHQCAAPLLAGIPFDGALGTSANDDAHDGADSVFSPGDRGFLALCHAYRASGGIARGDDLAHWLVGRGLGDSRQLAALLVAGDAFSFDWRDSFWVPMFQFQPPGAGDAARWREACSAVLAELRPVFDGWQLAAWFVQGNDWLGGARPLDLLATRQAEVLAAARADRFVSA